MNDKSIRFVPSRVHGLSSVTEVVVWPDRIELMSDGKWVTYRFDDIAWWPRPRWLWRRLAKHGWRPKFVPVADRDWFREPKERFFKFFTDPPIKVRMPLDETRERGPSYFGRVQDVMMSGGFNTYDLG